MKKARFNLDSVKFQEKPTLILLVYSCYDKRLRYSTKLKISPNKWNKTKMRVSGRNAEAKFINSQLDFIDNTFISLMLEYQKKGINPDRDTLKNALDMGLSRTVPKVIEKVSLFDFIELFIKERANQGNSYSEGTIKKYKTVYNGLKLYKEVRKKRKFDYDHITHSFYNDFIAFLFSSEEINSKNTVKNYITTLKLFMKEAEKRGFHNTTAYREFKGMNDKTEAIYLNQDEIEQLWKLDLSGIRRLERIRDLFLMGCETGLRFSDFTKIGQENIQVIGGVELIRMVQTKTKDEVTIPLKPIAKSILKKYNNKLPKAITNQKMNQYLKELGELAGLNEVISLRKGGKQLTDHKYKFISTHTARRSFATNAYLARVPSIAIMKITGHKSEKNFLKYIKVNSLQSALNIADHPFFTGKPNEKKSPLRKVS